MKHFKCMELSRLYHRVARARAPFPLPQFSSSSDRDFRRFFLHLVISHTFNIKTLWIVSVCHTQCYSSCAPRRNSSRKKHRGRGERGEREELGYFGHRRGSRDLCRPNKIMISSAKMKHWLEAVPKERTEVDRVVIHYAVFWTHCHRGVALYPTPYIICVSHSSEIKKKIKKNPANYWYN